MVRAPSARLVLSALVALLSASATRAEFVAWSFSASASPSLVHSDNHKLSWVRITSAAGSVVGSSHLVLSNSGTVSGSPATAPDTYTHRPFSIGLTITDQASRESGRVTFSGTIDGTASLFSSLLRINFTSSTFQRLHLGVHIYDIHLDTPALPGPPNAESTGSFGAEVTVSHNPEPSSLVLGAVGAVALGIARWRRRAQVSAHY
jgi:hypothetical protein